MKEIVKINRKLLVFSDRMFEGSHGRGRNPGKMGMEEGVAVQKWGGGQ